MISVAELAHGWPVDLALDSAGVPTTPVLAVDLSGAVDPADVAAAADVAANALPILVGVADETVPKELSSLATALDVTLVRGDADRTAVAVADTVEALRLFTEAAQANPHASVVSAHVMRQTVQLDVRRALQAEAAAYSMLLSGSELRKWLDERGPRRTVPPPTGPCVRVDREGDVLRVALARPERRNALDRLLREDLVEALSIAIADPTLQVELTGDGPVFSAGGDLDEFGTATDYLAAYMVRLQRQPGWLIHQLRDRFTARLHVACFGAGIEIPAFAGRVVATSNTGFVLPEVGMGLIPGAGGTVSIPRRIGRWRSVWMAVTGARIDAATALAWGLIDEIDDAV